MTELILYIIIVEFYIRMVQGQLNNIFSYANNAFSLYKQLLAKEKKNNNGWSVYPITCYNMCKFVYLTYKDKFEKNIRYRYLKPIELENVILYPFYVYNKLKYIPLSKNEVNKYDILDMKLTYLENNYKSVENDENIKELICSTITTISPYELKCLSPSDFGIKNLEVTVLIENDLKIYNFSENDSISV